MTGVRLTFFSAQGQKPSCRRRVNGILTPGDKLFFFRAGLMYTNDEKWKRLMRVCKGLQSYGIAENPYSPPRPCTVTYKRHGDERYANRPGRKNLFRNPIRWKILNRRVLCRWWGDDRWRHRATLLSVTAINYRSLFRPSWVALSSHIQFNLLQCPSARDHSAPCVRSVNDNSENYSAAVGCLHWMAFSVRIKNKVLTNIIRANAMTAVIIITCFEP